MAQFEEVRVARKKHTPEKQMPQSDNQAETNELPAEPMPGPSAKELAEAEERRAAELIQRATQGEPQPVTQDESLVHAMAGGREHLMQRMREHAAKTAAKKEEYTPPPITERQRSLLEEEQAAGRRARERHEKELANRPPPPAKEKWDGTNTPVHRPGNLVPDPTRAAPSGFVAGSGSYSADA